MYLRARRNRRLPTFACWVALGMCVPMAGCGGDPRQEKLTDLGAVRAIVADLADATQDVTPGRFESLFVEGAAPSDRSKYAPPLWFRVEGEPQVSGETATVTVKVFRTPEDGGDMLPVGQQQWTVARDKDGQWKLKDAPVP